MRWGLIGAGDWESERGRFWEKIADFCQSVKKEDLEHDLESSASY